LVDFYVWREDVSEVYLPISRYDVIKEIRSYMADKYDAKEYT